MTKEMKTTFKKELAEAIVRIQFEKAKSRTDATKIRDELGGIAFRPQNLTHRIVNGPKDAPARPYFTIQNGPDASTTEVLIYGVIGESWDGEGTDAKGFVDALAKIPSTNNLKVRINSEGGNVFDGMAIRNALKSWKGRVDTHNDGLAASIASVILLSTANGGKVHCAKESSTMIHRASTMAWGTIPDMQKAIAALENCEKNILSVYAEKTGKTSDELAAAMEKETWFTGPECMDYGMCDVITDCAPVKNTFNLSGFKNVPEHFRKLTNSAGNSAGKQTAIMNKEKIVALLKKHGQTVDENSTVEQLEAQLDAVLTAKAKTPAAPTPTAQPDALATITAQLAAITAQRDSEKKARIENAIDGYVAERRVPVAQKSFWVKQAMADESVLENLATMPVNLPPQGISVECTGESIRDIANHAKNLGKEVGILAAQGDARVGDISRARASFIRKNHAKFVEVWNEGTNTVDATLKQDVIIDVALRAFAKILAPLTAFTTKFENVALRGTNIVQVPFYDLQTAASTAWNAANGYVGGDTGVDNRPVTIDQRYYQAIRFTSTELARQPYLNLAKQMELNGQKLAYDVWIAIMGGITVANFATVATGFPMAAASLDSNAVLNLKGAADTAQWPIPGRSLFLNSSYDIALLKDNALKLALNSGSNSVLTEGQYPRLMGFDYYSNPNLPSNSESLVGFIAQKSALLVATAPIAPTEEVIRDGTMYQVLTDPDLGISMEYRSFGSSQMDRAFRVIECNYGVGPGNASALQRLTSA